jgi:hypothetical protein
VVSRGEIKLGEPAGAGQFVQQFIDNWHGTLVLNGDRIQLLVVDAQPPRTIFLANQ